jgi:predicted NBD/HSP70 family sugar kinase
MSLPRDDAGPLIAAGMDSTALRRLNTSVTLRSILAMDGPVTLARLTAATALSRRTVESILDHLIELRWVQELDKRSSTGGAGRPSRQFVARPDNALVAALRIDTFSVTAIVSDVLSRELGRAWRLLPDYFDPHTSLTTAAEALRSVVAEAGLPLDRVIGGTLATGGAVDENGVIQHIIGAPKWSGCDPAALLRHHFDFPWFVDNDTNLAALAEAWQGCAADHDTFVWVIVGNRAGVGILIHGGIHRGFRGAAGELVEATSIDTNSYVDNPIALLTSPLSEQRDLAHAQVAAARAGDRQALAELDEFIAGITPLMVTVSWTIAPPLIVLGGGLEDAADLLLPRLAAAMKASGAPEIPLRVTRLGRDAPLRGATKLTLVRLDAALFGPVVPVIQQVNR